MSLRLHAIISANPPEATAEVIAHCEPISVSESTCWVGVKNHQLPKPLKVGSRSSASRVDEICAPISQSNVRND